MNHRILGTAFAICSALLGSSPPDQPPQTRSPEFYLENVQAIGEPPFDAARKQEPGYLDSYKAAQHGLYQRKAAVLLELCRAHPEDPRVPDWMNRRWVLLGWNQDPSAVADEVLADIDALLALPIDGRVAQDAAYWRAFYRMHKAAGNAESMLQHAAGFADAHPADARGSQLLALAAGDNSAAPELRRTAYRRLAEQYPQTHEGKYAPGMLRRLEQIGRPFSLSFQDELTGRAVSLEGLRGKVVVVDFWATTCPPCVAEIPRLTELYARVAARGVEFIGVSLDESEESGGRTSLRKFLETHAIPWPQYYQGNGYDSEFSTSWGVGSAPTVFVIDKQGRLRFAGADSHLHFPLDQTIDNLLNE